VFREPVPGEGDAPVFIGNAALVEGMRPDVQAAYSSLPFAARAGWGYMLLTNMLPNGGNGTFRFHVYARDFDGNSTLLGSRTVTCTNNGAARPFGALDTPGQGEIVSGVIMNWGWALTPQSGAIPTNGSTIDVVVDGVVVGHPTYGFARPDLQALFPGYANTDTSLGAFVLDTTTMSNGPHTIAWIVRDNLGRAEGIGSRFFTVRNEVSLNLLAPMEAPVADTLPALGAADAPVPVATESAPAPRATPSPAADPAPAPALATADIRNAPAAVPAPEPRGGRANATAAPATPVPVVPAAIDQVAQPRGAETGRGTSAPRPRGLAIEEATTAPRASVTLDVTAVLPGALVTVTIANGPGGARDRVMFSSTTAPAGAALDWKFLNDARTAPAGGVAHGVVTLTAPSAPGRYVVRLVPEGDASAAASSAVIVVSPAVSTPRGGGVDPIH
jgi:hypothetical protein